jgi:hypothetical protein
VIYHSRYRDFSHWIATGTAATIATNRDIRRFGSGEHLFNQSRQTTAYLRKPDKPSGRTARIEDKPVPAEPRREPQAGGALIKY